MVLFVMAKPLNKARFFEAVCVAVWKLSENRLLLKRKDEDIMKFVCGKDYAEMSVKAAEIIAQVEHFVH